MALVGRIVFSPALLGPMVLAERVGKVLALRALRTLAERIIEGLSVVLTHRGMKFLGTVRPLDVICLARRCLFLVVARFRGHQRFRISTASFHELLHPLHSMRASARGGMLDWAEMKSGIQ